MLQQRTQGKTVDLIFEQNMEVDSNSFSHMYSPHAMTGRESVGLQNKEHQLDVQYYSSLAGSPNEKPIEKLAHMQTILQSVGPVDGTESQMMNEGLTPFRYPVGDPTCVHTVWDHVAFMKEFDELQAGVPIHSKSQHAFVVGTTSTNVADSCQPNEIVHHEMAKIETNECTDGSMHDLGGDDMEIEATCPSKYQQNPNDLHIQQSVDVEISQSVEGRSYLEGCSQLMHPGSDLQLQLPNTIPNKQESTFQQDNDRPSSEVGLANNGKMLGQIVIPSKNRGDTFEETSINFGYRFQNNIPTSCPTTFLDGSSDSKLGRLSTNHHITSGGPSQIDITTINFGDLNSPSCASGSYQDDSNGASDAQSSQGGESHLDESNSTWSTYIPSSVRDIEDSGDECEELDCERVPTFSRSAATEVTQPGRRTPLCHSKQKTMLQFLRECLHNPNYIGSLLHWVSEPDGHFRFEKSKKTQIAALWGQRNSNSQKKELKYEHFARAMRNYYGKGLERVGGKKLQYILHRVN